MEKRYKSENATLRQKAEELLKKETTHSELLLSESDSMRLIHELQVHQIELELQNEELILAKEHAENVSAKYAELYDSAPTGYFALSAKGEILELNLAGAKMLSNNLEILKNRQFQLYISNTSKPLFNHFLENVFAGNTKQTCELSLATNNDGYIYVDLSGIASKNGEQCFVTAIDITERKLAEEILREKTALLEAQLNSSIDGIIIVDNHGKKILQNQRTIDLWKIPQHIADNDDDHLQVQHVMHMTKNPDMFVQKITALYAHPNLSSFDDVELVDGTVLERYSAPVLGKYGRNYGRIWIFHDVTESKHAEESLKKQKDDFETIFNLVPVQIWFKDTHNNFIRVNRQACIDIGMTNEKIEGHSAEEIFPSFAQQYFMDDLEIINAGKPKLGIIEQVNNANGEIRWVHSDKIPVFGKDGEVSGLIAFVQDITERKLAEKEISILAQSLKSVNECVSITDFEDRIIFVNESFLKVYGYDENELIGKHISIVRSLDNPPELVNEILPATKLGVWSGELMNTKKDGSEFPIYLSTTIINDKDSKPIGLIGVASDITKRKLAEKELIEAKENAEESDRLKSSFLANMSHEVRTPLNSIIGFSELLGDPFFEEDEKTKFIQQIITNGNNLLAIISDIMDISKMDSGEIKIRICQINIQKFISDIKDQFSFQAKEKKLELKVKHPDNDIETTFFADPDRLRQIFNNLISNAIKFTAIGKIEIGYQLIGKMVEFCIKDTGIGIPEEYQEKIFERFRQVDDQTTREFGGNGLGLTISKNLIELMGGKIWLVSQPGIGSEFYFTLPAQL